jgi:hypothetical protein
MSSEWKQQELVRPHLDSFNFMLERDGGLHLMLQHMKPCTVMPSEFPVEANDLPNLKCKY